MGALKNTWFEKLMHRIEWLHLPVSTQNEIVVYANRRLGLKICDLWGEDYDQLRGEYFGRLKA
jgi:hypothetical protein